VPRRRHRVVRGDFQAAKFRLGVKLGERRPKIVLAALNEHMLRLRASADGVLLNYLPASRTVGHRSTSGRRAPPGTGAPCTPTCTSGCAKRSEKAVEYARRDLFSYAVVDGYAKNFTLAGFGREVRELRERHEARDRDGALAAISDAMIDAIDIVGDAAHVHAAVQAYVEAGVDVPVIMPLPWGPDRWRSSATRWSGAGR
jgi:hypothetical protein